MMRCNCFYLIICIVSFFLNCSIFEPRDSFEEPKIKNTIDVFQLEQILQCPKTEFDSLIIFTNMDHNDLFSADFVYQDVNSSREYTKGTLVNRLDQIDKPDDANWSDGSCTKRGDTLFVKDIEYIMSFNSQGEIRGQSDFTIVKNDNWQIIRWINYPSDGTKTSLLTPIQE